MRNKHNLVLYIDNGLVEKSKEMGFNLSKTFENHLKQLMTQLSTENSINKVNFALKNNEEWAEPELNRRPLACKGTHSDVDWSEFKKWLSHKYAKSHVPSTLSYCKRFNHIIWGDIRDIEKISPKSKSHVVKALIVLSKYLGIHEKFKTSLKNYGVKLYSPDAFSAFMRVYTNENSNLNEWLIQASKVLGPNEQLYLEFMSLTGLRKEEGITSFNKIIELTKQGNLNEYYNEEKGLLEHFKYKEQFLRRTKNVYISIVPKDLVLSISNSQPVSYDGMRKRLMRAKIACRINEQRDNFGTFMIRHGLIKEEVDLLQGRIPPSIFIRHYWSPSFNELKQRTLTAIESLSASL